MAELGRFPLSFKIWTLCIKYWLRLENSTDNVIVNNAMLCVKNENHEWLQNIKYILQLNGFGNRWNNPIVSHHAYIDRFALSFRKRLEAQYIQFWDNKCKNSELYNNVSFLKSDYSISPYLNVIKNPIVRSNFTKMRIGMSKFKFYTGKRFNKTQLCSNCDTESMESLEHVLFECNHFSTLRKIFNDNMKNKPGYLKCSNRGKLKIILNVDNDVCNIICSHISNIVSEYEKTL